MDYVCYDVMKLPMMQYHFTELSKEFNLLKIIDAKYKAIRVPHVSESQQYYKFNDADNIAAMIDVLNEQFAYLKDSDFKLTFNKDDVDYLENIPRAQEYLIKLGLLEKHNTRMMTISNLEHNFMHLVYMIKDPTQNPVFYDLFEKQLYEKYTNKQTTFNYLRTIRRRLDDLLFSL